MIPGPGGRSPISDSERPFLIPGLFMLILLWTKRNWERIFSKYFGFALSVSFGYCSILIFILILFLSEGRAGEAWQPPNNYNSTFMMQVVKKTNYFGRVTLRLVQFFHESDFE
jgi:hypothetical protein